MTYLPYPHWLDSGNNTWQLVAATLVGLMSIPGLAVLYGGLVQRKWAVNTMVMCFTGFSSVLIVWVLWGYHMGFGTPIGLHGAHATAPATGWPKPGISGFLKDMWGKPGTILSHTGEQSQASLPATANLPGPSFMFPMSTMAYFQFVFAAITPLLFLGSIVGRMKFKAWLIFVPLWITFVYTINAFLLWGGGWFFAKGAVDYSGGYVIHLAAGVTGFVAAAVVGPRLAKDRAHGVPNNLLMMMVGAGVLWLGWNGFNGGDPFFAGADAASAVLNTNLATAAALMTWVLMDMMLSKHKKAELGGAINGMIVGLVAITPSAGWVDGLGAILVGLIASFIVWFAWNYLPKIPPFSKVDDALGVVYTHGIAGLCGGLMVGLFADPGMAEYLQQDKKGVVSTQFSVQGVFYGTHSFHQLWEQFLAAVWVICFSAIATFILLQVTKLLARGLREPDEVLEVGDLAIHNEEVYPREAFAERILSHSGATDAG